MRQRRFDEGHIGLASQMLRVEAAGGTCCVTGDASGTVATVVVPCRRPVVAVTEVDDTREPGDDGREGAGSPCAWAGRRSW